MLFGTYLFVLMMMCVCAPTTIHNCYTYNTRTICEYYYLKFTISICVISKIVYKQNRKRNIKTYKHEGRFYLLFGCGDV